MLVDSHCHLNMSGLKDSTDQLIRNAKANNVAYMQTICTEFKEFEEIWQLTQKYDNIFCSVGVHPDEINDNTVPTREELIQFAMRDKVIGIGETGLDYYRDTTHKEQQIQSFREHIAASRVTGLPAIIHTRDAEDDTLAILKEEKKIGDFPALIHCFTASKEFAERVLELGLYISIAGIVTFKKAESLQEVVKSIPLDRLLIETDSPFLAPVPYRGKVNEPAFVYYVAKFIAELKDISFEEIEKATTNNFFNLFKKAKQST